MEDEAERNRYAEQVAIAFWNSIADDQDEVLFSSDEDPNHVYVWFDFVVVVVSLL